MVAVWRAHGGGGRPPTAAPIRPIINNLRVHLPQWSSEVVGKSDRCCSGVFYDETHRTLWKIATAIASGVHGGGAVAIFLQKCPTNFTAEPYSRAFRGFLWKHAVKRSITTSQWRHDGMLRIHSQLSDVQTRARSSNRGPKLRLLCCGTTGPPQRHRTPHDTNGKSEQLCHINSLGRK